LSLLLTSPLHRIQQRSHVTTVYPPAHSDIFAFFFTAHDHHPDLHLSLHDALPISRRDGLVGCRRRRSSVSCMSSRPPQPCSSRTDRKSTRLNSSHVSISYAVFCLKKKKS